MRDHVGSRQMETHVGDRIEVAGIRAMGVIGVLPEERERAQPFEIDLVIDCDLAEAGATDDLGATVHYGLAAERAVAVVTGETHELLERVAQRIAEDVLEMDRVDAVEVTVKKLRPPVAFDAAYTAVRITRP